MQCQWFGPFCQDVSETHEVFLQENEEVSLQNCPLKVMDESVHITISNNQRVDGTEIPLGLAPTHRWSSAVG